MALTRPGTDRLALTCRLQQFAGLVDCTVQFDRLLEEARLRVVQQGRSRILVGPADQIGLDESEMGTPGCGRCLFAPGVVLTEDDTFDALARFVPSIINDLTDA